MAQVHRPQSALQLPHSQEEVCREGKKNTATWSQIRVYRDSIFSLREKQLGV